VARDVIKADRIVEFTVKDNIAERFARRLRADAVRVSVCQANVAAWCDGAAELLGSDIR
jgi:hypothetical protein